MPRNSLRRLSIWISASARSRSGAGPPRRTARRRRPRWGSCGAAARMPTRWRSSGASPTRSGSKSRSTTVAKPASCTCAIAVSISSTRSCGGWRARGEARVSAARLGTSCLRGRGIVLQAWSMSRPLISQELRSFLLLRRRERQPASLLTAQALCILRGVNRHSIVGSAGRVQALDQLGNAARRDCTGHLVVRYPSADPAEHAANAYRDLAALLRDRNNVALRLAFEAEPRPGVMQQHLLLSIQPQQDDGRLDRHIAQRSINHALRLFAHDRDPCYRFRLNPSSFAQCCHIGIVSNLRHRLEAMGEAANTTIAMVLRRRREHASRPFDPEDATGRNRSGAAIRRCGWMRSCDAINPGRDLHEKGNADRRNREPQKVL